MFKSVRDERIGINIYIKIFNNMIFKMQFQEDQYFGQPEFSFEDSKTIQQDVPTLKEILARYASTGEIIGTQKQSFFDENTYQDCNCIVPDVEDLNIAYQNLLETKMNDEFLNKTQHESRQHNDNEVGGVEKPTDKSATSQKVDEV